MLSGQTIVINDFFANNYDMLVEKCQAYAKVYNYRRMQPDELVSELYLFTLLSANRTNKLTQLIELSAATLNTIYKYSNVAYYYIFKILYNITHGHRSFNNDTCNKHITVEYLDNIETYEICDEDYVDLPDYNDPKIIFDTAERLSTSNNNWWKYKIFYDYYVEKMTYRQLSEKYRLTITPLFYIVKDFNEQIRKELAKDERYRDL